MPRSWPELLARWTNAGVIDADTADRIRTFEEQQAPASRLGWPIILALAFGGLLLGSGVLLFVSANWDWLSPATRFALVLAMVGVFHIGGAFLGERLPVLATTLHAVGTISLGAGIALAGQIFNLDEHWPAGVMLWALGATVAWLLRRDAPQLALVAILLPAWLISEWTDYTDYAYFASAARVSATFGFLMALTYFTAPGRDRTDVTRRVLMWVGGIALLPAAGFLSRNFDYEYGFTRGHHGPLPQMSLMIGWAVAIGLPLLVGVWTRRAQAWRLAIAVAWTLVVVFVPRSGDAWWIYAWWGLGAIGLVAWGLQDAQSERINMGAVMFAGTVLAFYFSEIMSKIDRSASLVGLGLLFLGGGWALERTRRTLVRRAKGGGA